MCKDLEIKQLEYYVNEKENQYFDRKSSRIKPFDILKHLVGFANSEGGQLVIGIEDDGKITGFKCENCRRIEEYINISFTELKETPILPIVNRKKVKNYKNEDDEILILTINISNER
ncbi:ATP-binding protein [Sneathia sanguinegens]|uniref:ATP-binding protein n=1 Tax=Sneathia sanguinegens TaxID=40543 RepID=A0ABT7HKE7_9FUSO|nr:ATP-binding protein [Sneathia sanguinegens]MDK9580986.1 ATP-binding protein [Sneathia sanguinegens]